MVKGFSFWQTVIPIGCISDLVEAGLVLFIWLFGVASPSVYFLLTEQLLPFLVLGIIFSEGTGIRYRHQILL